MTETEIGPIDYLPQDGGESLFLLTRRQRDRLRLSLRETEARIRLLAPEAPAGRKKAPKPTPEEEGAAEDLRGRALLLETELLNDDLMRALHADRIRSARFRTKPDDGLSAMLARIEAGRLARRMKAALPQEGEDKGDRLTPDEEDALYFEASYQVLKPDPVEGWEGEIPPYLRYLLGSECHRELFPDQYRSETISLLLMDHEEKQAAEQAAG